MLNGLLGIRTESDRKGPDEERRNEERRDRRHRVPVNQSPAAEENATPASPAAKEDAAACGETHGPRLTSTGRAVPSAPVHDLVRGLTVEVGVCNSGAASDACASLSPSSQQWMQTAQSHRVAVYLLSRRDDRHKQPQGGDRCLRQQWTSPRRQARAAPLRRRRPLARPTRCAHLRRMSAFTATSSIDSGARRRDPTTARPDGGAAQPPAQRGMTANSVHDRVAPRPAGMAREGRMMQRWGEATCPMSCKRKAGKRAAE